MTPIQTKLIHELEVETGVNATISYCQVTGQPIGFLTQDVIDELFASIPETDEDDLKSEILTRTLMSCRTSPAWLLLRRDTLNKLRLTQPRKVLAYLMNRLCSPIDNEKLHMTLEKRTQLMSSRIKMWGLLQASQIDDLQLNKLLLILLELDARWNLDRLAMPRNIPFILAQQTVEGVANIIVALSEWLEAKVEKEIKDNKHLAESDRSFVRGNSAVKVAYMQELIRQTPPGAERQKVIARENNRVRLVDMIDEIERELTRIPENGRPSAAMSQPRTPIKPFNPPIVGLKLKAGFKFGGAKS